MDSQHKDRIAEHLRVADGGFELAKRLFTPDADEFQLRAGYSRLYYAFFHVSAAFICSTGVIVERLEHGAIPGLLNSRLGHACGIARQLQELYRRRVEFDYEPDRIKGGFNSDIEELRREAILLLQRAEKNFRWLYYEARKVL